MKFRFVIVLLLMFMLSACSNKLEKTMKGMWSIDYMEYNKIECLSCLNSNLLSFKDDGSILLPSNGCPELFNHTVSMKNNNWSVSSFNGDSIKLELKTNIFNGSYRLYFFKDEEQKLFKAKIIGKGLNLIMRKGFFNYQSNIKLMDELVLQSGS